MGTISGRRARKAGPGELSRVSIRALHEQVSDRLRELLKGTDVGKLPGEEDLMHTYQVGRGTVRKALQTLVDEGLLARRQGKGTFIANKIATISHPLNTLVSFVETLAKAGQSADSQLVEFGWIHGDEVPSALPGAERAGLHIRRIYLSDGVPHAVVNLVVRADLGRRLSREDVERPPIYRALREVLDIELAKADITVSCCMPSEQIADELRISAGTPVLFMRRVTRTTDDSAVEVTDYWLRSEVYQLTVTVQPEGPNRHT